MSGQRAARGAALSNPSIGAHFRPAHLVLRAVQSLVRSRFSAAC